MRLQLTEEETAAARDLRFGRIPGGEGVVVGLHVGGRGRKRWPLERWEAVISTIGELYEIGIVVLCGPGEEEEAARLRRNLGDSVAVFDDLDLRGMMALVGTCDFFITPDTGPLHVAVALDVPTVAVFLEKTWIRYGPRGPKHRTVFATPVNGEEKVLEAFAALVAERYRDAPPADADEAARSGTGGAGDDPGHAAEGGKAGPA